tara:strand:+ start:386 stop:1093 length:708 start_codon:yes stop_codon:yes gene_type:complete
MYKKKIIITRPKEQARHFVEQLCTEIADLNFCDFVFEPVLKIKALKFDMPDFKKYDGIIVTSQHALKFLDRSLIQNTPLYCVGQKCGDAKIRAATAHDLKNEIITDLLQKKARLLYLRGQDVSLDMAEALSRAGHHVDERIIYEAVGVDMLHNALVEQFQKGDIGAITFFSKRSAETFFDLAFAAAIIPLMNDIKILCISDLVVNYVHTVLNAHAYSANSPDGDGMIRLIETHCL